MQRPRLPHPPSPPSSLTVIPQVCWEPWLCVHIDYPAEGTVTLPLDSGGLADVGNIANDGAHKNMQFQEIREEIGQGVGWRVNKGIVRVHCQSRIIWAQRGTLWINWSIGLFVEYCLYCVNWSGKTQPKSGGTIPWVWVPDWKQRKLLEHKCACIHFSLRSWLWIWPTVQVPTVLPSSQSRI